MADNLKLAAHSFVGGMNKDIDDSILDTTKYREARNFRLLSNSGSKTGSLENIKGNAAIDIPLNTSDIYKLSFDMDYSALPPMTILDYIVFVAPNGLTLSVPFKVRESSFIPDTKSSFQVYQQIADTFNSTNPWGMTAVAGGNAIIFYRPVGSSFALGILTPPTFVSNFSYSLLYNGSQNHKIIGYCEIKDKLILLTCNDPADGTGSVFRVTLDFSTGIPFATSTEWMYTGNLNFSLNYPIRKAIGLYENQDVQRVIFTDFFGFVRTINLQDQLLFSRTSEEFDIIPDVSLSSPEVLEVMPGGVLNSGMIQYSYRQYNLYGQQTLFSKASDLVHLTKSSDKSGGSDQYKGSPLGENTAKSVKINISKSGGLDSRFNMLQVVAIYYDRIYGTPLISVVYDGKTPTTKEITIVDTGAEYLGILSLDEYNQLGGRLFKAKDIEQKNNYLIALNIIEDIFDVDYDARAYRYTQLGGTYLVPASVQDEDDCINPNQYVYNRKAGGSSIYGGTGANVSYEFLTVNLVENNGSYFIHHYGQAQASQPWSSILGDGFVDNNSFSGYASPVNAGQFKGYMRDETYRFGIVFKDKKGRRSFVKWIGDIKMPAIWERDGKNLSYGGNRFWTFSTDAFGSVNVYPLGLKFDINIPQDIADVADSFEIVRVRRKNSDRSIIAQGVLSKANLDPANPLRYVPDGRIDGTGIVNQFISPNYNVLDNLDYQAGDELEAVSHVKALWGNINSPSLEFVTKVFDQAPVLTQPDGSIAYKKNILSSVEADRPDKLFTLPGTSYVYGIDPYGTYQYKEGSSVVTYTSTAMPPTLPITPDPVSGYDFHFGYIANWKRPGSVPYGGNKYEDRLNSQYITCGHSTKITNAGTYQAIVFGGDTYITYFDFLDKMYLTSLGLGASGFWATYVPLESPINCNLRHDESMNKVVFDGVDYIYLQEAAGTYIIGTASTDPVYQQDYDLYQYNTVYSQEDSAATFFPKNPYLVDLVTTKENTIVASEKKKYGEIVDSWSTFLPANYIDTNSKYGPLNGFGVTSNYLVAFQDNAIGIPQIEEKAIVQDGNTSEIVLGTGRVLSRYDYLINTSGTKHQFSIINTPNAVHYFDYDIKNWKALAGGNLSISDTAGMKEYFSNSFIGYIYRNDNPHIGSGICGYYDARYNEAVMTFFNVQEKETISYNELFSAYNGFYDYQSPIYLQTTNYIYSVLRRLNSSDKIYVHNWGQPGTFYGTTYDSFISFLVNDDYNITKIFDSLKIQLESENQSGINISGDFFDYIRCYNKYQNSDWNLIHYLPPLPLSGKNIEVTRRERSWLMHIPRNFVDANYQTNPDIFDPANLVNVNRLFKERMRSQALSVELKYDNSTGNLINMPFAIMRYRASSR